MDSSMVGIPSPIDSLYLALVQCFGIIVCGYVAGRLEVITKTEANGLNTFVGTFSLPALIFLSMAKLDFSKVNWMFLIAVLIAKSLIFFIVLIVSIISTKPSNLGRSALFAIFTTQSNDFAIGYPMIDALYSSTHPEYSSYLYLMAPISLVILNPIGFVFLEIDKRRHREETSRGGSNMNMFKSIFKGIALNPILLMTVLGIVGNLIFKHNLPAVIHAVLKVLGDAFSATALFLLGLMMVGKIHKLKGAALVVPGILISLKLLVLPLIIRESIIFLNAGQDLTDTADLSTFGFLYGTIPTAPALFIFTLRYNIDIDLIASAMVVCTFASAPLMFISAKLIDAIANGGSTSDYAKEFRAFSFDTSAVSVAACIWLVVCFLGIRRKNMRSLTHRCTFCLFLAQLMTGVGVILWTRIDSSNFGNLYWYIQFVLITIGTYASRFWTGAIAMTLLFLSSQTTEFNENFHRLLYPICWGVPVTVVSAMCLLVTPSAPTNIDLENPNFQFGRVHVGLTVLILIFCFSVTVGSLILRQRYEQRNISASYSSLIPGTPSLSTSRLTTGRNVVDVEDLISSTAAPNPSVTNLGSDCLTGCDCNRDCGNENTRQAPVNPQILRHLILLILLLCSMFIGLAMTLTSLIMEEMSGIYTELAFLDVALGYGQSLIVFAIFGLDPGLGRLGCWLRGTLRKWRIDKELRLPNEASLTPETKAVRDQFLRCYLAKCRSQIAASRRDLLRDDNEFFTGTDLVDWLLEAGIAQDREQAVHYGRCLLDSGVLNHVDATQHFHDRDLVYMFQT
ncbi:hypothetical protein QAD02_012009 [Eretmocerus hayati]|uniref:Uncharacterized protein n=1 Tax=Eretmocerus hayati TaxID=131215 RepID=A0ACC2NYD0_9HYME|nr:hypothetical protein QAD02_012009 [Eretmocerus hayati]